MQKSNAKKINGVMLLWTLILTVALSFVCTPDVMAAKSKNNSNVKSVKVTNVTGKTLTLKKGNTKTLKVKVVSKKKKTKVPQTVTYKSSAPKVASVTQKGKITAKKAGTSKITITSKANKKKKITITVKVTAAAAAKPAAKLTASVVNASTVKVSLPKAQKLSVSSFTVKKKALSYSSRYNKTCKLDNITSSNNKDYLLVLDSSDTLADHNSVQVTVKGVAGTATATYNEGTFKYTDTKIYSATYNESVSQSLYADGSGYSAFTVANLPKGIKWEDEGYSISFYGKPSVKGKVVSTITAIDELGNTFTYSVTWVIGSADQLSAAAEPSYYVLSNGEADVEVDSIHVRGGSGSYKYELTGNTSGLTISETSGYISGTLKAAGTYTLTVSITDNVNASYKTTAEVVIYVSSGVTVSGMVKDLAGNAIIPDDYNNVRITFTNKNKAAKYTTAKSVFINNQGSFSTSLEAGTYDIEAYYYKGSYYSNTEDSCRRYLYSQKLTTSKSGFDMTLPLRKILIESSDPTTVKISDLGTWYDADGRSHGTGDTFYLKDGTSHKWTASNDNGRRTIKAEVNFTVNAATSRATAKVTSEPVKLDSVALGEKNVTITNGDYNYFTFTAPETKTYYFYSSDYNRSGSLHGTLEDIDGSTYGTDYVEVSGYNFGFSYPCEAGKVYYVGIQENWYYDYESPVTLKLNVSATAPVYVEPEAESGISESPEIESANDTAEVPAESENAADEIETPANEPAETPAETETPAAEETLDGTEEVPVESETPAAEETVLDETEETVSDNYTESVQ